MRTIIIILLISLSLTASPSVYEEGKKLYFEKGCSGCHGISASGAGEYPALAFRRKEFLEYKLKEFRAKHATSQLSQMMIPFALGLSDKQINALTTFFSEFKEGVSHDTTERTAKGDGGS
jgi:cytochrome c553